MSAQGISAQPLQWPAIIAGAIGAAGISFTLHAFAAGVGISVVSAAWRESSALYAVLAGVYVLFVAMAAFGFAGYIAGRMRPRLNVSEKEAEFRDGIDGLITWALAIVLTALLALGAAATASPAVAPSASGPTPSVAGETILGNELDELFRTPGGLPDMAYRRTEATRILLKASDENGVPASDQDYLATVVSRISAVPLEEGMARVNRAVDASATTLHKARIAAVLQAIFIGMALFVGAAIAWFAAVEGGREREASAFPVWDWSLKRRTYS